jgi:hypothetical protein
MEPLWCGEGIKVLKVTLEARFEILKASVRGGRGRALKDV